MNRPLKAPAYWQVTKARELWPDTSLNDICRALNCGRETLYRWRDDGDLDPLPERLNINSLAQIGNTNGKSGGRDFAPVRKVTAAPLQVEPLTPTMECHRCRYEDVCRERVRAGWWCACETPAEDHVRAMMEAAGA